MVIFNSYVSLPEGTHFWGVKWAMQPHQAFHPGMSMVAVNLKLIPIDISLRFKKWNSQCEHESGWNIYLSNQASNRIFNCIFTCICMCIMYTCIYNILYMISMISMYLLKISAGMFKSSLAGRGFHPTARHVVNEAGFEAGKHRAAGQEKGGGTPIAGWFIVEYSWLFY